MTQKSL